MHRRTKLAESFWIPESMLPGAKLRWWNFRFAISIRFKATCFRKVFAKEPRCLCRSKARYRTWRSLMLFFAPPNPGSGRNPSLEYRIQNTEVRSQKSEVRIQNPELQTG